MVVTTIPARPPKSRRDPNDHGQELTSAFIWTVLMLGCLSAWAWILYVLLLP